MNGALQGRANHCDPPTWHGRRHRQSSANTEKQTNQTNPVTPRSWPGAAQASFQQLYLPQPGASQTTALHWNCPSGRARTALSARPTGLRVWTGFQIQRREFRALLTKVREKRSNVVYQLACFMAHDVNIGICYTRLYNFEWLMVNYMSCAFCCFCCCCCSF